MNLIKSEKVHEAVTVFTALRVILWFLDTQVSLAPTHVSPIQKKREKSFTNNPPSPKEKEEEIFNIWFLK